MSSADTNSLKELDAFGIVGAAFSILKEKWVSFAVPFLVVAVIKTGTEGLLIEYNVIDLNSINLLVLLTGVLFLLLFEATLNRITEGLIVQMAADVYLGRETGLNKSLKSAQEVFLSIVLTAFFVSLIYIFGVVMLVIPAIIFWIMFSVVMEVVVLERKSVFEALSRSKDLASNNWQHIFGVGIIFGIISLTGLAISSVLDPVFTPILGEAFSSLPADLIYAGTLLPLNAIILTVLYFDLIARKTLTTKSSENQSLTGA